VDRDDLVEALDSGHLAGYAEDVVPPAGPCRPSLEDHASSRHDATLQAGGRAVHTSYFGSCMCMFIAADLVCCSGHFKQDISSWLHTNHGIVAFAPSALRLLAESTWSKGMSMCAACLETNGWQLVHCHARQAGSHACVLTINWALLALSGFGSVGNRIGCTCYVLQGWWMPACLFVALSQHCFCSPRGQNGKS